jgi:hypothetical protein
MVKRGKEGGTNWNGAAPQSLERMQKETTIVNTAGRLLAWGVCLSVGHVTTDGMSVPFL